ncbi:MAG: hypothetical protein P4L73_13585 [Caulobacteraceae bacterium]|nr:hypothetical protein [Caulobacteraceae bacterium]
MALPPIIGRTPQPPATTSPAADARTAAQRAFFQAALVKAGAPTAAQPAPARAETRAVQPAVTKVQDEVVTPPHPGRILRPGSLVDIKV